MVVPYRWSLRHSLCPLYTLFLGGWDVEGVGVGGNWLARAGVSFQGSRDGTPNQLTGEVAGGGGGVLRYPNIHDSK